MSATIAMLAGLGNGYLDGTKQRKAEERQAALDAQAKEEHDARMAEYKVKVDDRNALREVTKATPEAAYTQAQTEELGAIENVKDENGQPYYSVGKNPDGSSFVRPNFTGSDGSEYRPIDFAKKGSSFMGKLYDTPPSQSEISSMKQAKMLDLVDQGNAGATEAVKARQSIISDQGTIKLNEIKLTQANAAEVDRLFNEKLLGKTQGDFWGGIANVLTDTSAGGIGGVSVKSIVSADGKTVEMQAANSEGKYVPIKSFTNDAAGQLEALQQFGKADLNTKRSWLKEQIDNAADEAKAQREDEKIEIARQQANARDRQVDAVAAKLASGGVSGGGGGGGGGKGGSGKGGEGGMPGPMDDFDSKRAYKVAAERAASEAGPNDTPQQIATNATVLYREMEKQYRLTGQMVIASQAFEKSASKAKTPNEVEQVFQQGLALGFSPAQMAAIDGRFKQPEKPAGKPPAATDKTKKVDPPTKPYTPPPTMEQIQAETRANRDRILKQGEKSKQLESEPVIQALRAQYTQAIKAGKAVEANNILSRINEIRQRLAAQ